MAARYELRSHANDYDTPRMDSYDNARLSQSDFNYYDSQIENYLSDSFGSRFNNLNALNESQIRNNLSNIPKTEDDPALSTVNYIPSQSNNGQHYQDDQQQFMPLDDNFMLNEHGGYPDGDDRGGYAFSQEVNQGYVFVVSAQHQDKHGNRDYLIQEDLLFVRFNAGIGFTFCLVKNEKDGIALGSDMRIRMALCFCNPVVEYKSRVSRCQVHRDKDINGVNKAFPFIVNHRDAVYDERTMSVTIPASAVCSLTFHCYSSCAGGIDRKPVYMLFELLYSDDSVCQTASMNIKVCANPSRDAPKELEKKRKQEEKMGRARVKSEASEIAEEKRGRKRKNGGGDMDREYKRMESASPLHTPSPGWNPTMSAPRVSTSRRNSKIDACSPSTDGLPVECNGSSRKSSTGDDEDKVFEIKIQGRKKYEKVMEYVRMIEKTDRYEARNDEDNPFENQTQVTGELSITRWLRLFHLEEFGEEFKKIGINTVDDIEHAFNPSLFATVGIPHPQAVRLNKVYLNWLNLNKQD